jgi:hypothetical protein
MDVSVPSGPDAKKSLTILWADRRVRLLAAALLLVLLVAGFWLWRSTATLTVAGHHSFKRAEMSVYVDGDLKSTSEVSGSPRKKLGVFQKTEGTFSKSLRIAAGDHTIRVQFHSLTDDSDLSRQVQVSVQAGTQSTVYVNADRAALSLAFAGTSPKLRSEPEPTTGYAKTLQSILMAVGGSVLSATVGFVVQDFLRSRKAALQMGAKVSS